MDGTVWLDRMPLKIVLYFLICYGIWHYLFSTGMQHLLRNFDTFLPVDTSADWLSIAVTGVILYLLLKRYTSLITEREQNYRTMSDSGPALVWQSGTDRICTYFNKTWLEFTGRTLTEELGNGWAAGVHPDDVPRCLEIYTRTYARREKFSIEYRLRRHDGEYRWFQNDGSPRYSSDGDFIGYIGFCLDVTDRKQLEEKLAKSNEFKTAIIDCLSDGVVACDKDGRLSLVNPSLRELHGLAEQQLPPYQWAGYFDLYEKDGATVMKTDNMPLVRALRGQEVINQELTIIPKNARPRALLANGRQLVSCAGEKLGAVVSVHDVTMLKTLEEQIRQSQKLDSIGTLAGGVAHDFNNILSVIIAASTILEMDTINNPEQKKLIFQIRSSAERASNLTQSLLAFSRRQPCHKEPENLGCVISVMQDFLGRIIGEDVLLSTYVPDEMLIVMIDRGQIEQVLLNLAANARDAMPHGGVLSISVSRVDRSDGQLERDECLPGNYAMITVSDTGEGIDQATQQRIFEPFFTTKVVGRGTGLGLSIAYGIIRQHDGVFHLSSEPGEGTVFRIYLPLYDQQKNEACADFSGPGSQF